MLGPAASRAVAPNATLRPTTIRRSTTHHPTTRSATRSWLLGEPVNYFRSETGSSRLLG